MPERIATVLFLCTANSARSIMAEAILNRVGRGRFQAFSAGSEPAGSVHPLTIELLNRLGYETRPLRSKHWSEFSGTEAPPMDFVFTVCDKAAGEPCPVWPKRARAHWGVPDPALLYGSEQQRKQLFFEVYSLLKRRIELFCALPLPTLDSLTLTQRIDEIGRSAADSHSPSEPRILPP
ncbi:arsenate reductase ArsC [Methylomonas sp. HW2-6]|uniref:arsenate reductase ArsC n=1 Tax=Methylomonas sp. HW2-6 TaxID=3376687 RepID=UPI0040431FE4